MVLCVLEDYRHRGIGELLVLHTLEYGKLKIGYTGAELGWTVEGNEAIDRVIERVGAKRYKTYRGLREIVGLIRSAGRRIERHFTPSALSLVWCDTIGAIGTATSCHGAPTNSAFSSSVQRHLSHVLTVPPPSLISVACGSLPSPTSARRRRVAPIGWRL